VIKLKGALRMKKIEKIMPRQRQLLDDVIIALLKIQEELNNEEGAKDVSK
jgi:hypothetical protein